MLPEEAFQSAFSTLSVANQVDSRFYPAFQNRCNIYNEGRDETLQGFGQIGSW